MDIEWQRQQAQDENTTPEVLEELANSKDYSIKQQSSYMLYGFN